MPKLRVHNFTISLDGFAAGPNQRHDAAFGDGGDELHTWMFATRTIRQLQGLDGGVEGIDDDAFNAGEQGIGATIMGRNMFGPLRGPWEDHTWRGWWGDDPPYHHPVFVLTHHPRPTLEMAGGTTFHFVDESPEAALQQAFEAADGQDVRIGGGASTVRQYLRARLVDEMHVVIVPVLLGTGERLFEDVADAPAGYEVTDMLSSEAATHVRIDRRRD